jgi:hypothetical protein
VTQRSLREASHARSLHARVPFQPAGGGRPTSNAVLERAIGQLIHGCFTKKEIRSGVSEKPGHRHANGRASRGGIPHDFRRTAVWNLERAGVARSAAMAMVGNQTESIYRRYATADEVMLKENAVKVAVCHAGEEKRVCKSHRAQEKKAQSSGEQASNVKETFSSGSAQGMGNEASSTERDQEAKGVGRWVCLAYRPKCRHR